MPTNAAITPEQTAQADATLGIVRAAWMEALRHEVDPATTWQEAGADSLTSLHLVLHLERALGRKVSFDLLGADMTIHSLADALRREPAAIDRALPVIHLISGAFGDGPELAAFRRALKGHATFELIAMPDLRHPAALLESLPATSRLAAQEILRRAPDGTDIVLAGYSYGASVAQEAVHILQAAGRTVRLLINLDGLLLSTSERRRKAAPLGLVRLSRPRDLAGRFRRRPGEPPRDYGARVSLAAVMTVRAVHLGRKMVLAWERRIGVPLAAEQARHVMTAYRQRASAAWRPLPLPTPTVLVISEQFAALNSEARWRAVLPELEAIYLPGGHHDMFEPVTLQKLVPPLVAALDRVGASAR